ncbi:MAG: class I SAM-dependent RNA methyltransferase [Ignavibacteriota bacterium]|nr:MAG: class I SAM-dependent RNA methyltransferase [Chlorobiota bacterium]MBE7477415.1 class I SAM-dependent RNA methyltransferase [Ignavibacteriales bacterium]MBL1122816.1 class I SAM-dependent RNA methyltransferase [Ignavibacteriota bacterium]MCE7855837.1 class I SAM-dependent RNA methyltransferase [Ignavibacteria bacterium CHB3]MEB2297365.1 THUMP domain-containing protein [Ignavibacteria bacterium]GJQ40904.1 MAG: RNA methyltransferase [Ignavibacteriaceae bacterium]
MYEYKTNGFFAQVTGKMENICQEELIELGAKETEVAYKGVYFKADLQTLYKINYTSRLASRILAPLITFPCRSTDYLYQKSKKIHWEDFCSLKKTFSISASVSNSRINNSLYASQCLKDGIADYFRSKNGKRPDVEVVNPDVRFNLHIEKDTATISLDTSGESLHKRGYRLLAGEAPMQETLAAAIIRISKWDGQNTLYDPMCGSGTILCEALMHYCRIPAQALRKKFGFYNLPEFNRNEWNKVKADSDSNVRPLLKNIIRGSDKSPDAIKIARKNLSRLPYSDAVELSSTSFDQIKEFESGTLITNPPYGMRLGESEEVQNLYKVFGDFLKTKCAGTSAFIYTGNPELRKFIGLKTTKRIPLDNGKLEGLLLQIDSYKGSKKKKYQQTFDKNV